MRHVQSVVIPIASEPLASFTDVETEPQSAGRPCSRARTHTRTPQANKKVTQYIIARKKPAPAPLTANKPSTTPTQPGITPGFKSSTNLTSLPTTIPYVPPAPTSKAIADRAVHSTKISLLEL